MAVYAGDPGMGAIQIGRIFRLHHPVAQSPAKGVRIREEVSVVTHEAEQNRQETATSQKDGEFSPLTPIVEVEDRIGRNFLKAETAAAQDFPDES